VILVCNSLDSDCDCVIIVIVIVIVIVLWPYLSYCGRWPCCWQPCPIPCSLWIVWLYELYCDLALLNCTSVPGQLPVTARLPRLPVVPVSLGCDCCTRYVTAADWFAPYLPSALWLPVTVLPLGVVCVIAICDLACSMPLIVIALLTYVPLPSLLFDMAFLPFTLYVYCRLRCDLVGLLICTGWHICCPHIHSLLPALPRCYIPFTLWPFPFHIPLLSFLPAIHTICVTCPCYSLWPSCSLLLCPALPCAFLVLVVTFTFACALLLLLLLLVYLVMLPLCNIWYLYICC